MSVNHERGMDVSLGGETYRVIAQRQARILRRLFGEQGIFASLDGFTDAISAEGGIEGQIRELGGVAHDVLGVFIPDLMPRWQWDGYASQTAADADQYDEEADRSPTIPEVTEAFRTAVQVNGVEWLGRLRELIDPKLLRAQLNAWAAQTAAEAQKRSRTRSESSPSSPPPSGESDRTSSGTNGPTPSIPSPQASPSA